MMNGQMRRQQAIMKRRKSFSLADGRSHESIVVDSAHESQ
jgi:hypothetical protein